MENYSLQFRHKIVTTSKPLASQHFQKFLSILLPFLRN